MALCNFFYVLTSPTENPTWDSPLSEHRWSLVQCHMHGRAELETDQPEGEREPSGLAALACSRGAHIRQYSRDRPAQ